MNPVPPAALALGLAGLVPFLIGAGMIFVPSLLGATIGPLVFSLLPAAGAGGVFVLEAFGAAILAFMGGCLWGFATKRPGGPTFALLSLSAVPPFFAFASIREEAAVSCLWLAFGFVALQAIDVVFLRADAAPAYWLTLRLPLTSVVIACLLIGAVYG